MLYECEGIVYLFNLKMFQVEELKIIRNLLKEKYFVR
jgi:hypothetical protein